ncbi:MAG: cache domain-containing protein [Deltaproteobacteria bacterium]|nr:cache domain-containing protein [Deltaproteobacteria bacterium]
MKFKTKLVLFVTVTTVIALVVLTVVQMQMGQHLIVEAAEKRVARNIELAWQMLKTRQGELEMLTDMCTENPKRLTFWRERTNIDVLSEVDVAHLTNGAIASAIVRQYPPRDDASQTGIVALSVNDMVSDENAVRQKTFMNGQPAPALALFSVRKKNNDTAVVAAQLLTSADNLLSRVQQGLFGDERFNGRRIGTVTVFTGAMRTSTTVEKSDRSSAVGTMVSEEVAQTTLKRGESWTGPAYVVDAWYLSRYDPIRDAAGNVVGMLYIGELEEKLLSHKHQLAFLGVASVTAVLLLALLGLWLIIRFEQRAQAQRNRVRFEFLRVLGHELKAPINAVDGYLRIVSDETLGPLPEKYQPLVARSMLRIEYMRKLIADMLDLTRIEAGEKRREVTEGLDVAGVLREGVETIQPEAEKRGITIYVDAPEHLPFKADRGEMSIIINNLLTNAVKYNRDNGEVHAQLSVSNDVVQLKVKDTGIGMTKAEQAKLFGEFVRIRNSKTKDILGSGLGLHILKKIVGLYNGEVHVHSEQDVGSTFTVTLHQV